MVSNLMDEYIKKSDIGLTDFEIILCKGDYKEALLMLFDKIEHLPAADVRPVVKATWVMSNADGTDRPMPECSHCGWYVDSGGVKDFSFCPNCGAMIEES